MSSATTASAPPANATAAAPPPAQSPKSPLHLSGDGGSGVSTSLVVGAAVGRLVMLLLASFVCLYCLRKKRRHQPPHYGYSPPPPYKGKVHFCYIRRSSSSKNLSFHFYHSSKNWDQKSLEIKAS